MSKFQKTINERPLTREEDEQLGLSAAEFEKGQTWVFVLWLIGLAAMIVIRFL